MGVGREDQGEGGVTFVSYVTLFLRTPYVLRFAFLAAKNNEFGMFLKVLKEKCK